MNHVDPKKPLMVVVDLSVFLHRLDHCIPMIHSDPQFESVLRANLIYLLSGDWLPKSVRPLLGKTVLVMDSKPYWRSEWLRNLNNTVDIPKTSNAKSDAGKARGVIKSQKVAQEIKDAMAASPRSYEQDELISFAQIYHTIAYKSGRKLPSYRFKKITKLVIGYLADLDATCLGIPGYEADDMAASLVATNTANGNTWNILLLTVDSDWMGLINPNVTWVCMSGFAPRVRDTLEICNLWAEKRLKETLGTWRDIWDIKGRKGDASDNLPASDGILLPVIDLLNPPAQYRAWDAYPIKFQRCFSASSCQQFSSVEAVRHLKLNGLFPEVRALLDPLES